MTRETSNSVIAASFRAIQAADGPLQLIVSPEGTRNHTATERPAFIEADVRTIKAFYAPFKGKNAGQFHAGS